MDVLGSKPVSLTPTTGEAPSRRSVEEVAQEFEAMLLSQMLRQLKETLAASEGDEEDGGLGLGDQTMAETIDVELARQLSKAGGIGLADELKRSMMRTMTPGKAAPAQPAPAETESPSGPVGIPTLSSGSVREQTLRLPLDAAQSSAFGWRADPFHGTQRFHAGIDLKAAYGREVPAAGEGRVSFAGEQGGYGLTVVVDHTNGTQTRYAHLSSLSVKAGEEVAQGTLVGRVGSTGRSTGPHLHFEVLVGGQPVDPQRVVSGRGDGIKVSGEVDD